MLKQNWNFTLMKFDGGIVINFIVRLIFSVKRPCSSFPPLTTL